MKLFVPVIVIALSIGCEFAKSTDTKDDEWIPLFNGKDLTGWEETDYAGRGKVIGKERRTAH